jgi:FRG domain
MTKDYEASRLTNIVERVCRRKMMKRCAPIVKTTEHSTDLREWIPSTFDNFLREAEHLSRQCEGDDPLMLYRGHTDSAWLLDCTLVRSVLKHNSQRWKEYPRPLEFHTQVVDLLLAKFGCFLRPSQEAYEKESTHGIDPWYELMKKFQQYEEHDTDPKGTFLVDWTRDSDIALYFATYDGREGARRPRQTDGAVWVCDPVPTGKVLQTAKLQTLLDLMRGDGFRLRAEHTLPLILHPAKQTKMLRAINQKPVYFAQMDFRYDLADLWCSVESTSESAVFRKLILKESLLRNSIEHLERHGLTEKRVYPE